MRFARIDTAIALAKKHSAAVMGIDARLHAFIVGHLVVEVVSEFEQRLEAMFVLRARKLGDPPNTNFVSKMLDRRFRSPDVGKINAMLKDHDAAFLTGFANQLAKTKWDSAMSNLMINRHYYVHKEGAAPTMSLHDVAEAYDEAVKLFDAMAHALGLTAADCAHFT
jgi:hypothetical protein